MNDPMDEYIKRWQEENEERRGERFKSAELNNDSKWFGKLAVQMKEDAEKRYHSRLGVEVKCLPVQNQAHDGREGFEIITPHAQLRIVHSPRTGASWRLTRTVASSKSAPTDEAITIISKPDGNTEYKIGSASLADECLVSLHFLKLLAEDGKKPGPK